MIASQLPPSPIIVKIVEPPGDPLGIGGVLIGALGLAGAVTVIAVLVGLVMGGVLFFIRWRRLADRS